MSWNRTTYGPWHTLRITSATWYCTKPEPGALCLDPEGACNGHLAEAPGREVELDRELEHPQDCIAPPCCCKWPEDDHHQIDPTCEAGLHDECLNRERCWTQRDLFEDWDISDMPTAAGVYRVRVWGSGPDHNGEYDAGIECEPIEADRQMAEATP